MSPGTGLRFRSGLRHSLLAPVRQKLLLVSAITLLLCCVAHAVDGRELHLLCWSEYVPETVISGFEEKSGVRVVTDPCTSNEQMLAKLRAKPGFYDLIQPSGFYVSLLANKDELAPLDLTRIPNIRNIDPKYRNLPFDPKGEFSVPWLAGTIGIVVNTERTTEPVKSWANVFSGKYSGRIVVVDDSREMVTWALASLGLPITDVSDAALVRVESILKSWLPQIRVFDSDSPKTAMLDGRADIGIIWSGEAALLWQKDRRFHYVLPEPGAHMFVDSLAIPKGAPHKALAEDFINHILEPTVSVLISNTYPYTNPNAAARRLLTPEQSANSASYPPGDPILPMLRNEGNTTETVETFVRKLREQSPNATK